MTTEKHIAPELPFRENRFGGRIVSLAVILFAVAVPLALASHQSFLAEPFVEVCKKVAAGGTACFWVWLWYKGSKKLMALPNGERKKLRLIAIPFISAAISCFVGFALLFAFFFVGDVIVWKTATQPRQFTAAVTSITKTRGCMASISFYDSTIQREGHICGDQFLIRPVVGKTIQVEENVSPFGAHILWVRHVRL